MVIRVLLADDQPLVRAGLVMLLDAEPDIEVVAEASDGQQALAEANRHRPDVVVMDVRMPVVDGIEAARRITASEFSAYAAKTIKVLILTCYHVDDAVYGALRAGASGFLLKDTAPADLAAAVRAVSSGDAWLHPAVARGLLTEFAARPASRAPSPEVLQRLTAREREVLTLVAGGLSNAEIAERLVVGQVTVKTHFGRILMKLGLRDRAQAIVAAYESGLVVPRGGLDNRFREGVA
ncbi:MAG: response regulator [Pseudonocardiaceae bacterium]